MASCKIKIQYSIAIVLLYLLKGAEKLIFTQNLHMDSCGSFIYNGQNLEATKMCFYR